MCGIAGMCHMDGPDGISSKSLKKMIGVLCHRGPDETGMYLDDHVGLGHARLSIIDLLSGDPSCFGECYGFSQRRSKD